MKRTALALTLCLIAAGGPAQARMHDYSLSPEESLRQPNISNTQPNNFNSYFQPNTSAQQPVAGTQDSGAAIRPSNRFMVGYCDPNFRPAVSGQGNLAEMQACAARQKQQTCQEFQQLPADAQDVLDASIGCAYMAANTEGGSGTDCSAFDERRLQLLKKYGNDQATSHALIYMQDEVLNASGNCAPGGR